MFEKLLTVAHSKDCNATAGPGANLQQNSPGTTLHKRELEPGYKCLNVSVMNKQVCFNVLSIYEGSFPSWIK